MAGQRPDIIPYITSRKGELTIAPTSCGRGSTRT